MSNPDKILKAQRQLSVLSGTKQITQWLLVGQGVLGAVGVVLAVKEGTSVLAALQAPLMILVVCELTRSSCAQSMLALEKVISS